MENEHCRPEEREYRGKAFASYLASHKGAKKQLVASCCK